MAGGFRPTAPTAAVRAPATVAFVVAAMLGGGVLHFALTQDEPNPYSGTQLVLAVVATGVGYWVAMRRRDHPLGWVLLVGGAAAALVFVAHPLVAQAMLHGSPEWVMRAGIALAPAWLVARTALFIVAPSVVPGGRPTGIRAGIMWVGVAGTAAFVLATATVNVSRPLDAFGTEPDGGWTAALHRVAEYGGKATSVAAIGAVLGLAVAVTRAGAAVAKQQRFFLAGAAALLVPSGMSAAQDLFGVRVPEMVSDPAERWALWLLPALLVVAIVQDGMLDIAVVVRRVVVFSSLTAAGAAVYVGAVGVAWLALRDHADIAPLVGTGAVALALVPLRSATHRWASRRVYGRRDEPYQVLAHLGRRLADVPGTQEALPALVAGIADGLRIPHVAVELDLGAGGLPYVVAAAGSPMDAGTDSFPLVFAGREVGRLLVSHRTPTEGYNARERALLSSLAQHAGIVAHDAVLAADLQRSRMELVMAREEERRRLRGDLHDGLGPTLASVSMGLEAAAARLDDDDLVALLGELNEALRDAMQDIRRLVYGLRPPALDELGLVRAIEAFAGGPTGAAPDGAAGSGGGPRIEVVSGALPPLPAAVEVAAYRVTIEALTNVRRHAHARHCAVELNVRDNALEVVVRDDGIGLDGRPPGVGIVSMRQRAADLGGRFELGPAPDGHGTEARLTLPLETEMIARVPA